MGGVAYIVFVSVRELVMRFRQAHSFSMLFVLMCVIPVSFLNAFLFWWITVSLSELLLALELRKQTAKLVLFRRLWWVLVLAVTVAVGALLYQIFVFSMDIAEHWQEQWVLENVIGHTLFLAVLVAMMYLWAPHQHSQLYTHFTQIGDRDDAEKGEWQVPDAGIVIADDDDDDDDWGGSDDGGARGAPKAQTVGRDDPFDDFIVRAPPKVD